MLFRIAHTTRYLYSRPVTLAPHVLRLRPRSDGCQRVLRAELKIEPRPAGLTETLDLEGNAATEVWFLGETDSLSITAMLDVETLSINPYHYIVTHEPALRLPAAYPSELEPGLAAYRRPEETNGLAARLAARIAEKAQGDSVAFLSLLAQEIKQTVCYCTREAGEAQPAAVTLSLGEGSCRDLAIVFLEAARSVGLAARFVSGYQLSESQEGQYLHAWGEIYLPGGGWRGYDPTLGLATSDTHIVVAAGRTPTLAAPVSGAFMGGEVHTQLQIDLRLEPVSEPQQQVWARPQGGTRSSAQSLTVQ